MFAIAIPFAIFALPVLLKKLDCGLVPVEIGDGSFVRGLSEIKGFVERKPEKDEEDLKEGYALNTGISESAIEETESSMDINMEEETSESLQTKANVFIENSNGPESLGSEDGTQKAPEVNGIGEGTGSDANETLPLGARSARRTSSRVASLRAAFEQAETPAEVPRRRFHNGDRSSQQSMEAGKEYEAEIERLKAELEKENEMRIAYEERMTTLEDELEELKERMEDPDQACRKEYEHRGQKERNEGEGRSNVADEARDHRLEAETLKKQLSELKRSVSTSTRPTTQVSDATFRDEIGVLQHEVQNWVVNNFRRVRIDASSEELCRRLKEVADPGQFERLWPIYEGFDSAVKLPVFQTTVAAYLLDIFADPHLYGLPSGLDWVERLREAAEILASLLTATAYNRWRAITFDALRQCDSVKDLIQGVALGIAEKINTTLNTVAGLEVDETKVTSLKTIIKRTIDLAHLIRVQEAQYCISLPAPRTRFDANSMDDIFEDGDSDAERLVRCATFVSMVKIGGEGDESFKSRSVIVKAKVLCDDSEP